MKKRKKWVEVRKIEPWELPESFDSVIDGLSDMRDDAKRRGYSDLKFSVEVDWDGMVEILIHGSRDETDAELAARKKRSEAAKKAAVTRKANQQKKQRAEFERLRKALG